MRSSQTTCQVADEETNAQRRQAASSRPQCRAARGQERALPLAHVLPFLNHVTCRAAGGPGTLYLHFKGIELTETIVFLYKANLSAVINDEYSVLIDVIREH